MGHGGQLGMVDSLDSLDSLGLVGLSWDMVDMVVFTGLPGAWFGCPLVWGHGGPRLAWLAPLTG